MTLEANFTPFLAIMQRYIENVVASMCCNSHKSKINKHEETKDLSQNLQI